jgi:hypothetical protein
MTGIVLESVSIVGLHKFPDSIELVQVMQVAAEDSPSPM